MVSELAGLGRLFQTDPRNMDHRMPRKAVPAGVRRRHWNAGAILDQGSTPQCVGYAGWGWLAGGPVVNLPTFSPTNLYHWAQDNDEWPGRDYDGSSTLGLMKALKARGYIDKYIWAFDAETLMAWVLTTGPVLVGTNWHREMFMPRGDGFLEVAGPNVGGHEYRLVGADRDKVCPRECGGGRGAFRQVNTWGRGWGEQGRSWISAHDLHGLIRAQGEAVTALEIKL